MRCFATLSTIAIGLMAWITTSEGAPEYLFCLAADYRGHVIFLTNVFHSTIDRERLRQAVMLHLTSSGRSFDVVQCPRQQEQDEALIALQIAEKFNQESRYTIIHISIANH